MRKLLKYILLPVILAAGMVSSAHAANEDNKKDLGKFGVWRAFAYKEGGQTVCYMATAKTEKAAPNKKGRTSYLMITHRPVEGSTDVFSYGAGVALDSRHSAELKIGKNSFELFSVKENAWSRDAMTDHKIAVAIKNASAAQVTGIPAQSRRAATVGDKFSLTGAAQAYHAISKACGVPNYEVKKPVVKKPVAKKPLTKKTVVKKTAPKKQSAVKTTVKKPVSKQKKTTK